MHQLNNVKNCYDLTAAEYAKSFYHELEHKPFDRLILQRFAAENNGKMADLGCGPGHTTKFLADLGVKELVGIDLSPEMIKVATKLNPHINFEAGNMLDLGKPDEEFGAVLALYSIVHFAYQEIEQVFSEIYRVLKTSGQFLLSFHVGETKTTLDEFLDQKVDITFYFLEVDKILQSIEKVGFKIIDAIIRYPYKDVEYPSQRAYLLAEK